MTTDLITSRSNPLIKELRSLALRKTREQRGEFLIEGIQLVLQALERRAEVRRLIVAPELLKSEIGRAAVQQAERAGIQVVRVSGDVFGSIAEREHPTGLAAVVKTLSHRLESWRV